jgi:hypothetical protein
MFLVEAELTRELRKGRLAKHIVADDSAMYHKI